MEIEQEISFTDDYELEDHQLAISTPKVPTITLAQRKHFRVATPFCMRQQTDDSRQEIRDSSQQGGSDSNKAIKNLLDEILANQKLIFGRLDILEHAVKENVLDRGAIMAHHQTVRECKVIITQLRHSINRLTGEVQNPIQIEIAASLPISTIDAALEMEEKLTSEDYAEAMRIHLCQLKGGNSSVNDVLRKIITDDLLILFNFEGRKNKKALTKLKLINEILFDVFQCEGRSTYDKLLRKCVELSHNRYRQKKLLANRSVISQPDA